jgi:hypothetical protein
MRERFDEFHFADPAAEGQLESLQQSLGVSFPADYLQFLREKGGGEGFVGSHYLILWRPEELPTFNREYQFPEYAPSMIAFGTDGGGEAFAFDRRSSPFAVAMVPLIGMSDNEAVRVADGFDHLLDRMNSVQSLF